MYCPFNGKPVFCDVDENTFCINMNDAENRITDKTRGIVPVHLFLQTADMATCMEFAKKNHLAVLGDAAEAFGMRTMFNGEYVHAGLMGDFGTFSFVPTKTLGGYGDGGMIATNNEELYKKQKVTEYLERDEVSFVCESIEEFFNGIRNH